MLPLGICKRCEKAGADCRTTASSAGGAGKNNGNDRTVKRKSPPIEMDDTDSDPSTHSASFRSPIENDLATFHHSSFSQSPGDSLIFNIDGSGMLDLGALETEVSEFHALEAMAGPTTSTHFQYPESTICQPRPSRERGSKDGTDSAYDASASSTPGSSGRSSRSGGVCVTVPVAHSQDDDQDERKRLLDLHILIFDGLHRITDGELANFLFMSDNMTPASRSGDPPPSDIVGRVLVASERLIELLEIFSEKVPAGSTCDGSFEKFYSLPDSLAERQTECEKILISSTPPSSRTVALPVVLSFLACYVGLLAVYRTIFSHIQEMLLGADTQPSGPPGRVGPQLKRMCPTQAEGISLNHGQMLRIRIHLEVMTHMLDRIRWAWSGFRSDHVGNENDADPNSKFRGKVAVTTLLQGMLMHEGFDCSGDEFGIGLGSLQATLENIRLMLRGKNLPR